MKWGYDQETADCICSLNRYCAEYRGYFAKTNFVKEATSSGTPSFITPRQQIMKEFFDESLAHAWPSFRDEEVVSMGLILVTIFMTGKDHVIVSI